eukprot:871126-Prorocentrum_minimum.AAC.1
MHTTPQRPIPLSHPVSNSSLHRLTSSSSILATRSCPASAARMRGVCPLPSGTASGDTPACSSSFTAEVLPAAAAAPSSSATRAWCSC